MVGMARLTLACATAMVVACGRLGVDDDRIDAGFGDAGAPQERDAGTKPLPDGGPPGPSDSGVVHLDGGQDAGKEDPSGCGDGLFQPGELCDDGNNDGGDGCAATCDLVEPFFVCPVPGEACVSTVVCGDSRIEANEECDDGDAAAGDGCTDKCLLEPGWFCPAVGEPCQATACGDMLVAGTEQCDDDDTIPSDGDGCGADCRLEDGWSCPTPGTMCIPTVCNDGKREGTEACDDGNNVVGDGCDPFCHVEPNCSAGPCKSACGDGLLLPDDTEQCDDGNTSGGDGCSAGCVVEDGYNCTLILGTLPDILEVPVTYRDFIALPSGLNSLPQHPDFEAFSGDDATPGLVDATLGIDGKPVYADNCDDDGGGTCDHGQQLTTKANFDQWYRDTPGVNITLVTRMSLDQQLDDSYQIDNSNFLPMTGLGWDDTGDEDLFNSVNFGFTSEVRSWFEFKGDEMLAFSGDDDVWVFINGQLAVDIGGLHPSRDGSVALDGPTATALGLQVGSIYEIALFHAERHTHESNFKLTLNGFVAASSECVTECGDGVVAGDERCDDGVNDGSYGSCTADCMRGPFCGDGVLDTDHEACDDGTNLTSYSNIEGGCAPGCRPSRACGDGAVDSLFGEQCDDGSNPGGYGECEPDCTLGPRCGDGERQADDGEECDDGNLINFDACDDACQIEAPE